MSLPDGGAQVAALATLTQILEGAHRATPDQLGDVVGQAGAPFGWDLVCYLVDFDQTRLTPLAPTRSGPLAVVPVDGDGDAGRAFRHIRPVHGQDGVTWVPVLDGVERLGVLRVTARAGGAAPGEHTDALRWMAMLIGHLVAVMTPYGDVITEIRGGGDRTVESELLWTLLPPLTYASQDVVVSAAVQPPNRVAGDAFDYAVRQGALDVGLFDGTGHDLSSGLLASAALAAYRRHRRRGGGLVDCARAIDEVLRGQTDAAGYATGVLLRLDTVTGALEYVNAGHLHPLLLREGRVLESLDTSGRPLFGFGEAEVSVGQVQLHRGDQLVLYTDGITEARDEHGAFFGIERLKTLFAEHAAHRLPAPETLRLVMHSVLEHQRGVLQDDATLLLVEWSPGAGQQLLPA